MMAPSSASEEEGQGKELVQTTASTAPEQQQEEEEFDLEAIMDDRKKIVEALDSLVSCRARSYEVLQDARRLRIVEALDSLVSCRARCSEMLQDARRLRIMGDHDRRCLAFLDQEISNIVLSFKTPSPQHADRALMGWLEELSVASDTLLHELDAQQRHSLLPRAVRCIRHRYRDPHPLRHVAEQFYRLAEDPCRYERDLYYGDFFFRLFRGINWFRHLPSDYDFLYYDIGIHAYIMTWYAIMFPCGYKFELDRLVDKWLCEIGSPLSDDPTLGAPTLLLRYHFSDLVRKIGITRATKNPTLMHSDMDEAEALQFDINYDEHRFLSSKLAEMGFACTSDTLNLLAAVSETTDHDKETASRTARRLALHHDDPNIPSLVQKFDLSHTRSLAVSGAVSIVPLEKFVNLVVLDVQGWENFGDHDLLLVCSTKMFFLKYLSIRNTRVSKLPPQMKELCSLQVLDASNTLVAELQLEVFQATRFIHRLDLRGTPIRHLTPPVQKQLGWQHRSLEVLLTGGEGMVSSAETATRVPHDILRFRRLHTLSTIDLSEQPASFVKALGDLQYMRVLAITWSFHQSSDRDYCDALLSSIQMWRLLKSLTIHCGLGCSMGFLDSISDISWNLETFKVTRGRFSGVPQWFHGLGNLSSVQITVCKLGVHDLEILGDLFQLKRLILGLDFIPKEAIVIKNEGFHELERFSIDCPVPWLTFESGAMPKLTYLQLDFCACPTNPTSVPLGISNLRSLTEVALRYNVRYANSPSVKMTVEAVRKDVAKRRNTFQVISIFINGNEQDDVQAVDETEIATGAPSGTNARAEDAIQAVHEITEE